MVTYTDIYSSAVSDTFQAGQHKTASFVPAYASAVSAAEQQECLAMLECIPKQATAALARLSAPNYQVDRLLREAILAPSRWQEEMAALNFTSSDKLAVYLGTPRASLNVPAALTRMQELRDNTAITARIVLGLWNIRRSNTQFTKNRRAAMRLEEVLEWRGIKKQSYLAHPDLPGSSQRCSNGYATKYKEQVLKDIDLLASCCVWGLVNCTVKGKKVEVSIRSPYLTYSIVRSKTGWAEDAIAGVFVAPGEWINAYTERDNYFLAEIDRKTFQFHPQRQQHELRLALYLTERWRQLAKDGNFAKAIPMSELLAASMISVDKAHLTSQFAPRIEHALHELWQRNILGGGEPKPLEHVDKHQLRWGNAWLASRWILPPPSDIQEFYTTMLKPPQPQFHPRRTRNK